MIYASTHTDSRALALRATTLYADVPKWWSDEYDFHLVRAVAKHGQIPPVTAWEDIMEDDELPFKKLLGGDVGGADADAEKAKSGDAMETEEAAAAAAAGVQPGKSLSTKPSEEDAGGIAYVHSSTLPLCPEDANCAQRRSTRCQRTRPAPCIVSAATSSPKNGWRPF